MKNTLPAVDAYIEQSADFAKPILKRVRKLFHQACPQIREEMKWSFPHFVHQGIVGSMAAFKRHVSWGFWNAKLMPDPRGLLHETDALSSFGFKPRCVSDLPPDEIILEYILAAVALNEQGVKRPAAKRNSAARIEVPKDLCGAEAKPQSPRHV